MQLDDAQFRLHETVIQLFRACESTRRLYELETEPIIGGGLKDGVRCCVVGYVGEVGAW